MNLFTIEAHAAQGGFCDVVVTTDEAAAMTILLHRARRLPSAELTVTAAPPARFLVNGRTYTRAEAYLMRLPAEEARSLQAWIASTTGGRRILATKRGEFDITCQSLEVAHA